MIQLHISKGNSKIGGVPSISFPPHVTCAPGVPCRKLCYAYRLSRIRKSVQAAWNRNLVLWNEDKKGFERQLTVFLETTLSRYFRWFVAGDIPDKAFLALMARAAFAFPEIKFMAYTKRWREWRQVGWPSQLRNLVVRHSLWPAEGWDAPRDGLPFSAMIPKGADIIPGTVECPGECGPCGYKCWDRDVNVSIRQH
jgi:hypothetical protein